MADTADLHPGGIEADAAAERYRRAARNPLIPRHSVEELLTSMNRIIEVTEPDPRLPAVLNFSSSRQVALSAKRAIEQGLAERDTADRAEPRRRELSERLDTALSAMTDCVAGMQDFERTKSEIETAARNEGFDVDAEGCVSIGVSIGPHHKRSGEVGVDADTRRARYEHRLMSVLAGMAQLQEHAVATISERLGADEPGIPWTILECARAGIDLGSFESGAQLPSSPLRELMQRLATDMARANAAVSPNPPTPPTSPGAD